MIDSPDELVITTFGELEAFNALQLRVFRKEISPAQAEASWNNLADDIANGIFGMKALPDQAFERAQQLSRKNTARLGTRSADLLHVAVALELGAECLYSFDRQQRKLAQALRLKLN